MLPIPFKNFIPKIFRLRDDSRVTVLCNKVDSHLLEWKVDVMGLSTLFRPDEVNAGFVSELNYFLNSNIAETDTETIKRKKIKNSISRHKNRSTWVNDVKLLIDSLSGYNAVIFSAGAGDNDDSIDLARQTSDPDYYWSTEQDFSTTNPLWGTADVGDIYDLVMSGNIAIDCHYGIHTPVLSADKVTEIKNQLLYDVAPAYMLLYLGYVDSIGNFVTYSGGIV